MYHVTLHERGRRLLARLPDYARFHAIGTVAGLSVARRYGVFVAPARAIFFDPTKVDDLASALSEAESRFADKPCESEVSVETTRRIGELAAQFEALAIQAAGTRIGAQGLSQAG